MRDGLRLDGCGLFITHVIKDAAKLPADPKGFKVILVQSFVIPIRNARANKAAKTSRLAVIPTRDKEERINLEVSR